LEVIPMRGRVRIALLAAVAVVTAALGPAASAPASLWRPQTVTMTITPSDRPVPMNIAVWPGNLVVLKVRNYSHEFHTFTIPALGVSALILPARDGGPRVTTVRFLAQRDHRPVFWFCVICPSGIHGQRHAMAGGVYPIAPVG